MSNADSLTIQAPPTDSPDSVSTETMSLDDHLHELRHRLIVSVVSLVVSVIVAFLVAIPAMEWLKAMAPESVVFIQLTPGEVLIAALKIALMMGIARASPMWL